MPKKAGPKKNNKRKASRKTKQKNKNYLMYILFFAIVLCLLFILLQNRGKDYPGDVVIELGGDDYIKKEVILKDNTGTGVVIKNLFDQPAECILSSTKGDDNERKYTGIVMPGSEKYIEGNFISEDIEFDCSWDGVLNVSLCENTTFLLCNAINQNPRLISCLENDIPYQHFCIALVSRNSSFCNYILDNIQRIHCIAYNDKNPELCEDLGKSRDWCYQDLAMNWCDSELCEEISDDAKKVACIAVVERDVEMCKSLDEVHKLACILQLAEIFNDKSLCEFTEDKEACYEELHYI